MEVALRRRLEGVADVTISQRQQTAAVTFLRSSRVFSAVAFREAIAEADVDVLRIDLDVCGVVSAGALYWTNAGTDQRLVIRGVTPRNGPACLIGQLNDTVAPSQLLVARESPELE